MKYAILFSLLAFSFTSLAGTCKLSSRYYEGFHCPSITTKLVTENEEHCRALAQETRNGKFFGILTGKAERVLRTKYVFKDGKRKVKDMVVFEDIEEVCY